MAKTNVRTRSKPKQQVKKEDLKTGMRILVEDLRVGDRIVTSWHRAGEDGAQLSDDEVMDVLSGQNGESHTRFVNRSVEVKKFEECPSQWRTHVHVNKSDCYDMRTYVWIVKQ